ncbi:hypothetical protein PF005_g21973 [Phytophthora fragariae]|uniref:Uncharacterized protein n=1 Tax=Phytophthora fragariae TaxID=53985 RepID=A0A6A3WJ79_9STRA|nr:hypothetical protein PF009_g22821 [Phytophthora fragariae]KAE9107732.1 hypothetical protein PF006_g21028 [Phytophthora fragariae]KAE9183710.1 hypothetical protein PF005_g21973 [Phytophthora fragariae]KAE9234017.1 hypothetical protein PF004_g9507 [Phytophthora fragariae]KAE9287650.1 hypothetical protein PF001_g20880 [Phytophthora fragariae]
MNTQLSSGTGTCTGTVYLSTCCNGRLTPSSTKWSPLQQLRALRSSAERIARISAGLAARRVTIPDAGGTHT